MPRACVQIALAGLLVLIAPVSTLAQPAQETGAGGAEVTLDDSPLVKQPQTPAESFEAAVFMVKLDRPKLARLYLEQFTAAQPDEELLLQLHDKHGQAAFLQLANTEELKPLATDLLDRVNRALRKRAADPDRIDQLLAMMSGTVPERKQALRSLRAAGTAAVPRIVQRIAADPGRRVVLLETLVQMGQQVVPPLRGALDAPDPNIRAAVVEVLGRLRAAEAVPWLWSPAFGPEQPTGVQTAAREALARVLSSSQQKVERVSSFGVAQQLRETALVHYKNQYNWQPDEQGLVDLWTWQPETGTVDVNRLSPEVASLFLGARFAREALAFSPQDGDIQSLYAGVLLALDRQQAGWNAPLPTGPGTAHDLALTLGPETVSRTLAQALAHGRADAAEASLRVLAQIGSRDQLTKSRPEQAPILAALNYPDRRVQFAAAVTVLELDPVEPFRASRRVVQVLQRALNDNGSPSVVVTHANSERARIIGSFANQMGFDPLVAMTGQDAFRLAAGRSDVELILLDINTIRWGLSQTTSNLRADARTASIPIVIYGPVEKRAAVEHLLHRHELMTYVVEPATADAFKPQVEPFLETLKTAPLTAQQRAARRRSAAFWLAHIAAGRRTRVFDIEPTQDALVRAAGDADLAEAALQGLSAIPSREVQSVMAQIALNENRETALREDALIQLAFHIQRFGLLLTDRETAEIVTRWRSTSDAELATALASIVGSLKPGPSQVQRRLSHFPAPTPGAPTSSAAATPESSAPQPGGNPPETP